MGHEKNGLLTPPRRLSSYDDGEENAAHPHMMICQLRRNACIEERCQKGKEDLSQASFKYTHFAVAGKSSYENERRSLRHHHMMISDAEGLNVKSSKVSTLMVRVPYFRDHKAHRSIRRSIKKLLQMHFFSYIRRTGL